jgi:hypothetical protein
MKEFKLVTKDIYIDIEQIKKIIINKWQSGQLYRFYYEQGKRNENLYQSILASIALYADDISDEIMEKLNLADDEYLYVPGYPKSDKVSIIFEVLRLLDDDWSTIDRLTTDDIPTILEFLDTPLGKELEAWEKWEKYWASLDYPTRRKKLLENAKK